MGGNNGHNKAPDDGAGLFRMALSTRAVEALGVARLSAEMAALALAEVAGELRQHGPGEDGRARWMLTGAILAHRSHLQGVQQFVESLLEGLETTE